ncbi:MAG: DUF3307 domain-containing protein [Clostridia bacterium]|nr:DUF3307 domain-containing protein [Clostridia bacterium]
MFKQYLILLLIGHVTGEFYIIKRLYDDKEKSLKCVLIHFLSYLGAMLLISLPIISLRIVLAVSIASISHMIIYILMILYVSLIDKKDSKISDNAKNPFFIDQILHFMILFGISFWVTKSQTPIISLRIVDEIFSIIGISKGLAASWILVLLLIHKPANLVIQNLLIVYKPMSSEKSELNDNNAGRFIGTIERIIILILLSIGQYSSIGLVLTAKSIARYDKISKEKDFADYYLLGTLLSTLIVIGCSFII